MNFVVFSDDWGRHPSSSQHIFQHVARHHPVLWVNTVGMRAPKLTLGDFRKAFGKIAAMLKPSGSATAEWTERPPLLRVIQPPMLPMPRSNLARRFNDFSLLRAVQKELVRDSVIVTTVPNSAEAMARLGGFKIYYCVDDFSQWPGLAHDVVRAMEDKLVENVDLILAASPTLKAKFSDRHAHVELFAHGVDLEQYREPLPPSPEWLSRLPGLRVGFYGLLDERLDQALVALLAGARPEWSFVLAGPRVAAYPALENLSNVHFPGNIPYRELPGLVRGLDALIIPYRTDSFTHTLAPLKLNEYLLSGRTVITSALDGVPEDHPLIRIARSSNEWLEALDNCRDAEFGRRREFALEMLAEQSWEVRAASLLRHSTSIGTGR